MPEGFNMPRLRRYWRDSRGKWRDRYNKNRPSKGPERVDDLRKYPKRKHTPPIPTKRKPKPKIRPPKEQTGTQRAPHAFPSRALFSSPFRQFLTLIPNDRPKALVTVYAILKRTLAKYQTQSNRSGVRIYAKQVGTMTQAKANRLTVADVRELHNVDRDGVLAVLALKGRPITARGTDPTRSEIARGMQAYLRALDKGTRSEALKKLPKHIRTRKGRKLKPGGKGKRKRYKQTR